MHTIHSLGAFSLVRWFRSTFPTSECTIGGRYVDSDSHVESGSRFDDSTGKSQALAYRKRYWNEHNFKALRIIADAAAKENLTVSEVALRWMSHHSLMKKFVVPPPNMQRLSLMDIGSFMMQ